MVGTRDGCDGHTHGLGQVASAWIAPHVADEAACGTRTGLPLPTLGPVLQELQSEREEDMASRHPWIVCLKFTRCDPTSSST